MSPIIISTNLLSSNKYGCKKIRLIFPDILIKVIYFKTKLPIYIFDQKIFFRSNKSHFQNTKV